MRRLSLCVILALAFLLLGIPVAAEPDVTTVSGVISRDTTWSGNVLVTERVTVSEGVTLTVEPGTIVRFKHWRPGYTDPFRRTRLDIGGTLMAVGTPEKPIRFTSDAPNPEHSDWDCIQIGNPAIPAQNRSILDYCIVEFGIGGVAANHGNFTLSNSIIRWCRCANVWIDHSSAIITRNRIYDAGHGGIEIAGCNPTITYNTIWGNGGGSVNCMTTSNPTIHHNAIINNRFLGITIIGLSNPTVEYNNITGNVLEGIKIAGSNATIRYNNIYDNGGIAQLLVEEGDTIAINNWWGTADKEEVESSIQIRKGSASYEPYLTSPVDIGEIKYDYENNETYAHPPRTEKDTYTYFFPTDETRRIVASWTTVNNPTGIAWDGEHFWVVNFGGANRLLKYDPSGNLVDSLTAPGPSPMALAYDGQYLWSVDFSERSAHQFDFSGNIVKTIPVPEECLQWGYGEGGLAYDGQYLWKGLGSRLYKFDTSGNLVDVVQIQIDWIVANGLAWDGEHLWVSDAQNEKIFEVDPSNGNVLRWITAPGEETWGMVWIGDHLWACEWTNDWNNYIIVEMELTPSIFTVPTPTPEPTPAPSPPVSEECSPVSGELIVVDGLKEDWQEFSPSVKDPKDDTLRGNVDVKALYGFTDGESLYLMVEFHEIDVYHHVDVHIDVDGDKNIDYVCSIIPCHKDFVFRKGEEVKGGEKFSVLTGITCKQEDVVEIQIPLSLFENKTEFHLRAAFFEKTDGEGHYIDETDLAHVGSLPAQPEEKPIPTPTPPGGGLSCARSPGSQSSVPGDLTLLLGIIFVCFGLKHFRRR